MADPYGTVAFRPAPGEIPESPGVYRFRDQRGRVIYVGKAKSLRQRLNQYFADFAGLHPRTQMMLQTAAGVEWTVVGTEVEALQLEYSWIKEFDPRFNIKYRDDKSYPYLAVTMGDEYPRVMVMRGAKRKGTRYFGPYSHAWAIRDTVDTLLRVFPVRTCSAGVFKRAGQIGRPIFARSEFSYPGRSHARTWLNDAKIAGSGPIGDVGVHCIDTLRYILQDEVVRVGARGMWDADSKDVEAAANASSPERRMSRWRLLPRTRRGKAAGAI